MWSVALASVWRAGGRGWEWGRGLRQQPRLEGRGLEKEEAWEAVRLRVEFADLLTDRV